MDRDDYFYDDEMDEGEERPGFFQRLRERLSFRRREDELLAKIGRQGLDSLTRRERAELEAITKRRRERGYRG